VLPLAAAMAFAAVARTVRLPPGAQLLRANGRLAPQPTLPSRCCFGLVARHDAAAAGLRALHQTARSGAAGEGPADGAVAAGLALQEEGATDLAAVAAAVPVKKPTSAAHPLRGRGPSPRPRNRFKESQWWRGWRFDASSGTLGVEGDFPVASVGPLLEEDEWDDVVSGSELDQVESQLAQLDADAIGLARVLHDSEEGDFPIQVGDLVVVNSKLNPVGALGRSGELPIAWPPKRKKQRRRMIVRELQRQRDARRRVRETAAANVRKAEKHAAKVRVAVEMAERKRNGELPISRVALVEARAREMYAEDEDLHAWATEMFGEEAYRPPPGKAKGVSLVH